MSDNLNILEILQKRFVSNMARHIGLEWADVCARLKEMPQKLEILARMEETGGEPDVVGKDANGGFLFFDCAKESPIGRRSYCYDRAALEARKAAKPTNDAISSATEIGVELLDEAQYAFLQTLGEFDTKTSSWLKTPEEVRSLGGAIFADRRFDRVFAYHNGAESYYAARGFRGCLRV